MEDVDVTQLQFCVLERRLNKEENSIHEKAKRKAEWWLWLNCSPFMMVFLNTIQFIAG